MKTRTRLLLLMLLVLLSALLAACGSTSSMMKAGPRELALTNYGVAIRWSEFDDAYAFVDPTLREQQPLTDFERERFKQIQVTGYDVKSKAMDEAGGVAQTVEIRLISKHTQIERSITDRQSWRWDEANKRLWLTSGLPDFAPRAQ